MKKSFKQLWYVLTHWEQWHYNVKYILLSPVWTWYSLRARSFYFFTPANPTLTFGGMEGGAKSEIYNLLPKDTYPISIYIDPSFKLEHVETLMVENGLAFPIAVKPNVGMMGLMFRKIDNTEELSIYHRTMTKEYIVQQLVHYPTEVSVFYYRIPGKQKGNITGFVRKEALEVIGDGNRTLETLMQHLSNRPGFKYEEWANKHSKRLQEVVAADEIFKLSWVANLSRGARLVSLENEKDEKLLTVFDDISHAAKHLYYGRYDIKCKSIDDLKEGKNFLILEFNGSGAEPHHMYGNGNNFFQASKIIIHHWHMLFSIAKYHNRQGVKYPTLREGLRFTSRANKHFKHLRELDLKMPVFH
jgi:hypothetical protein